MNRRNNRGWVIDVSVPGELLPNRCCRLSDFHFDQDHDVTVEFYFRNFAELNKVNSEPEFQALQASEGPFVNLIHTVVTLGWVEKYVDGGKVVNIGEDGKSLYPPWSELNNLSTAFPARPAEGAQYSRDKTKDEAK